MKRIYTSFFITAVMLLAFMACSKDNKGNEPVVDPIPEFNIGKQSLDIKVGEKANIPIEKGAGEYKAFSLNPEIVKVELVNNALVIDAVKNGKSAIVISDKEARYKSLPVVVYTYDEILVNKPDVEVKFKLGNPPSEPVIVDITQGNGDYKVTSDNKNVEARISYENKIFIYLKGKAEANVTVSDYKGLKTIIKVHAIESTEPYTEEELEVIKSGNTLLYRFEDDVKFNLSSTWLTFLNTSENGKILYGYEYEEMMMLKIYFAGDKTVGVKKDATLSFKAVWGNIPAFKDQPIKFEIIKNDGTKIWAIYSFVKENKLYSGFFVQSIEP